MLRTQISLTDEQKKVLDSAAARTGRSVASLIREAVDRVYADERSAEEDLAAMREAFGSWSREEDGEAWVERMRSGRRLTEVQ